MPRHSSFAVSAWRRPFAFVSILSCTIMLRAGAQPQFGFSAAAEQTFSQAVHLYKEGNYSSAAPLFDELAKVRPIHQRTTASLVMAGKVHLQLHEFARAVAPLRELVSRYPESAYADEAQYALSVSLCASNRYDEAISSLLRLAQFGKDKTYSQISLSLIDSCAAPHLTPGKLNALLTGLELQDARDLIALKLGEDYYAAHDYARAQAVVDLVLRTKSSGVYRHRIRALQGRLGHADSVRVKVGVLLPLTRSSPEGSAPSVANEVLDGIQFAVNRFNEQSESMIRVSLELRDTQSDSSVAKRAVRDLAGDKDLLALIGPLFSMEAFACGRVANAERVPLLSPTANADSLTASGTYMFQLNPDLSSHARTMARFAVQERGMKTLAVLAPRDSTAMRLAREFVDEALRLGGAVIAEEYYPADLTDLRQQFMELRTAALASEPRVAFPAKITAQNAEILLKAGAPRDLVDTLLLHGDTVDVKQLLGPRGRETADSLHLTLMPGAVQEDNIENPVTNIDAIYTPITDAEQIGVVGSQTTYFNIKAQVLGSAEWNDLAQLEAQKRYVEGVIFSSDAFVDKNNPDEKSVESAFAARQKAPPTRYTLFGVDAMNLLLSVLVENPKSRQEIARALGAVSNFQGIHTTISFDKRRVNTVMNILQYHRGEIRKLCEVGLEQ